MTIAIRLSAPVELRTPKIEGARIGVFETFYDIPVQPAIRRAVREAAAMLAGLGFAVDAFRPEGSGARTEFMELLFRRTSRPRVERTNRGPGSRGALDLHRESGPSARKAARAGLASNRIAGGAGPHAARLSRADEKRPVPADARLEHRRVPTSRTKIRDRIEAGRIFQAMMPVTSFNLLGLPALTCPIHAR